MKVGCKIYKSKIATMLVFKALTYFSCFLPRPEHKVRSQVVSHSFPTPLTLHQNEEPILKVSNKSSCPLFIPLFHHFFVFMASFSPSFLREKFPQQNPQHFEVGIHFGGDSKVRKFLPMQYIWRTLFLQRKHHENTTPKENLAMVLVVVLYVMCSWALREVDEF